MEEREQVRLAQEGNEAAFSWLVKKYEGKVFGLAYGLTGNRETADDLAQEVFIKAFFALPKFRFEAEFGTWLYRIAVNKVRDYLRKKRSAIKEISLEALRGKFPSEEEPDRKEQIQRDEQRADMVRRILPALPAKYSLVLALRDIRGCSYDEISGILKVSPGTVDSRLHRARKMLRKKMEPLLAPEGERS